jgi:selenium metabolism protein YedF
MAETVDARGLACPIPVVRTREALRGGAERIEVLVDNATARDNVSRFAASQGCAVEVAEEGECFRVLISRTGEPAEEVTGAAAVCGQTGERKVVVLSSDIMGRGDEELGRVLIKAFLNTLAESDILPWRVVLFNRGVLLAVEGAETVQALANLSSMGVEILVCGTCLDFFGLKEKVAVGTVSNMFDILGSMLAASSSVTV